MAVLPDRPLGAGAGDHGAVGVAEILEALGDAALDGLSSGVPTNRSTGPLVSGPPTKAWLGAMPRTLIRAWDSPATKQRP